MVKPHISSEVANKLVSLTKRRGILRTLSVI